MDRLSQADINHNYKFNIINGIFATMAMNLVMPFVSVLALRMGASNFQMGLISSLPPAVGLVAMLPGAIFVERFVMKRWITGAFIFAHRLFFVLLALTPVLPTHQVWFLVIANGLMNFPGSIANVAWQSFIAGAIPSRERARAFAHRNRLTSLWGIIITFVAGLIFRWMPEARQLGLYQIFFVVAFAFALLEVWAHFQMKEAVTETDQSKPKMSLAATGIKLISTKPYVVFCICSLIFHFGWQMAWPLFTIHQVRNLGADEAWVSIISVVNGGMSFLTYGIWRTFSERRGNHLALVFATLGISLSPFLYAASTNLYHVVFINGLIGIAIAGINLVLFNSLLDEVPDEGRTIYIAAYTTLINLSATIAPMIGISLLEGFGMTFALIAAGVLRFLGSVAFGIRYKQISKEKHNLQSAA